MRSNAAGWRTRVRSGFLKLPWVKVAKYGYTSKLLAWIYANDHPGVTVRELAHLFDITHHAATGILVDFRGSNKTIQKPNKTIQESNINPSDNAALHDIIKQDHTGSKQNHTETEQEGSVSICSKDKDKEKKKYIVPKDFELPDWVPVKAWDEWMTARPKKASWTLSVMERIVKNLGIIRDRGYDPEEVLMDAATNSWQGLKPEWDCFKPQNDSKPTSVDYSRDYLKEADERVN